MRSPKPDIALQMHPHKCQTGGKDHAPGPADHILNNRAQDAVDLLAAE